MSENRITSAPEPNAGVKHGSQYIASSGPDVCKTPMGSSTVPVAYNSIAFLDDATALAGSVRLNGSPQYMIKSKVSKSTGTEPGVAKGVVKGGCCGPAHITEYSKSVRAEGGAIARDGDPATINGAG